MDFTETESESEEEDIDIQELESVQETNPVKLKMSKLKQGHRVMIRWNDSDGFKNNLDPYGWQSALVASISPKLEFSLFQSEKELDPPEEWIQGDMVTAIDLYDGNKTWNPQKYYDFAAKLEKELINKDKAINTMKSEISFMVNYIGAKTKKLKKPRKNYKKKRYLCPLNIVNSFRQLSLENNYDSGINSVDKQKKKNNKGSDLLSNNQVMTEIIHDIEELNLKDDDMKEKKNNKKNANKNKKKNTKQQQQKKKRKQQQKPKSNNKSYQQTNITPETYAEMVKDLHMKRKIESLELSDYDDENQISSKRRKIDEIVESLELSDSDDEQREEQQQQTQEDLWNIHCKDSHAWFTNKFVKSKEEFYRVWAEKNTHIFNSFITCSIMKQDQYDNDLKKKLIKDLLINSLSKDDTIKKYEIDLFHDILQTC